ncbi:DUF4156 domain-containing protein [Pseudoxanthomonas spadix]|jgi:hypothetical protein|uniref:DUF4156 domain-containing protein n=1 Tax=Pseudoxanthomonas spadix TaxID=415229 RepID=UPI000F00C8EE|nr:DUF4156 domain-containing protein [Pseudoxanthomonas spadix]MBP3975757.1 DUF4156 domain-containing protein [Pseudoxanthomonas spadix]RMW97355.1 DUF4156 domain-containing protein [Pseudoxanthomonas spadix]
MRLIVLAALLPVLSACTWVELSPQANAIKVVPAGRPSSCQKLGEVAVSVKDKVAFYQRNDVKVRDELETLARNEALTLHADTIQPMGEPVDGEQRFGAYRCR